MRGAAAGVFWSISALWGLLNIAFWFWWLQPEHVETGWLFWWFTVAFFYQFSFLPSVYLFYVGNMARPVHVPAPAGVRVAMISLCVPSAESVDVISRQMRAMQAVQYPHDSWILDEGNDPAIRAEAERLGVRYFTRAGITRYNQPDPPFKATTKAGNVNAWLDAFGSQYDFFVQLDVDHTPIPGYLDRVLGYFQDDRVAWIQAPSVYGNLETWVARGSAEQELVLQGPLQMGFFGVTSTPFIIGSHSTYRTSAVLAMGGFQPTRAEDHLDTLVLAARDCTGCFVPEVIAVGRGPDDFETYLRQQFAWAYSMMQVLLTFTPRLLGRLRPGQVFQFLYAESWYICWSSSMGALFALPALSLLTGQRLTDVPVLLFVLAWLPLDLTGLAVWKWTHRWHFPHGLGLSWRGIILNVARWPIVLWAFLNVLLNVQHPYMITPKGSHGIARRASVRPQLVYLALVWGMLGTILLFVWLPDWRTRSGAVTDSGPADLWGYALLGLWGSLFPLAVAVISATSELAGRTQRGLQSLAALRRDALIVVLLVATFGLYGSVVYLAGPQLVRSALWLGPALETELTRLGANPEAPTGAAPPMPAPTTSAWSAAPAVTKPGVSPGPAGERVSARPAALALPAQGVAIGAYDPHGMLADVDYAIERWYVRQSHPEDLEAAMDRARDRRTVLVTIEPLPPAGATASVLELTAAGSLDDDLSRLAAVMKDREPQIVYAIWAHEMEIVGLYPWSVEDANLYRAAFRHVVRTFRAEGVGNVQWIWSPAGNPGAERYYPGDDVVDFVGTTVLEDASWDRQFGAKPQTFHEIFGPRYTLLATFDKPVVISELGVSGDEAHQAAWLAAAAEAMRQYPRLRAATYFNAVNEPNPHMSFLPDWTVSDDSFRRLLPASQP